MTLSVRSEAGNVIFGRQVSAQPEGSHEHFNDIKLKTADYGYVAILEVCGFNGWLLAALPNYGACDVVLIQPAKIPRVKTDRRDAHSLSLLLWLNRTRIGRGRPIRGVNSICVPSKFAAENQRENLLRQQTGRQRARTTDLIKYTLHRHNLVWDIPTNSL